MKKNARRGYEPKTRARQSATETYVRCAPTQRGFTAAAMKLRYYIIIIIIIMIIAVARRRTTTLCYYLKRSGTAIIGVLLLLRPSDREFEPYKSRARARPGFIATAIWATDRSEFMLL